jgi:hypothetical protein
MAHLCYTCGGSMINYAQLAERLLFRKENDHDIWKHRQNLAG